MIDSFSDADVEAFGRDGFLIIEEGFISEPTVMALRERFDKLFRATTRPESRLTK